MHLMAKAVKMVNSVENENGRVGLGFGLFTG